MRADIQRKPLGFQEITSLDYRCVVFCVVKNRIIRGGLKDLSEDHIYFEFERDFYELTRVRKY